MVCVGYVENCFCYGYPALSQTGGTKSSWVTLLVSCCWFLCVFFLSLEILVNLIGSNPICLPVSTYRPQEVSPSFDDWEPRCTVLFVLHNSVRKIMHQRYPSVRCMRGQWRYKWIKPFPFTTNGDDNTVNSWGDIRGVPRGVIRVIQIAG